MSDLDQIFGRFEEILNDETGWSKVTSKRGVNVFQKQDESESSFLILKGEGTVMGLPQDIVQVVQDLENRGKWDLFFEEGKVVQQVNEDHGYGYLKFKGNWTVWPRDFSLSLAKRETENSTYCVAASVQHDDIPEVSGCVRGTILASGFRITPLEEGGCRVTYIIQVDLGGWLPNAVANQVNTYQPLGIIGIRKLVEAQ
eukprot:TRINITY_DN557_c0_g1_i1.p1 TRINITY_DN557_c0_g1~~TRINITY_DN557_c0_g1_i1.p1  ORF type:complete len:199 (-),score=28.37 TRINITY_DN557_c0_g1_i1:101-697(-)